MAFAFRSLWGAHQFMDFSWVLEQPLAADAAPPSVDFAQQSGLIFIPKAILLSGYVIVLLRPE
jgi:hypothetical protein